MGKRRIKRGFLQYTTTSPQCNRLTLTGSTFVAALSIAPPALNALALVLQVVVVDRLAVLADSSRHITVIPLLLLAFVDVCE